ncbi:MAG: type I phosphomannose isomerase catalytic subunit [Planctomycetota bacterium]
MPPHHPGVDCLLQPLRLRPIPVQRVWGGERILREVHPGLSAEPPIGESWCVSDVGADASFHSEIVWPEPCPVDAPRTLREWLLQAPREVLGARFHQPGREPRLPLLYKFIDAREALSVQVHPDDALVAELGLEGAGKTEAWIILDAAPGASIVYGLEPGLTYEGYLARARVGRGAEGLARVPVQRGDIAYLPAGTLHAIGAGVMLAEIQQSSDTTYRIYDWDRPGLDGRPRTLHLDEAARVRPVTPPPCPLPVPAEVAPGVRVRIADAPFRLTELRLTPTVPAVTLPPDDRFAILSVLDGQAELADGTRLAKGEVLFYPAAARASAVTLRGTGWALWMEPTAPA